MSYILQKAAVEGVGEGYLHLFYLYGAFLVEYTQAKKKSCNIIQVLKNIKESIGMYWVRYII